MDDGPVIGQDTDQTDDKLSVPSWWFAVGGLMALAAILVASTVGDTAAPTTTLGAVPTTASTTTTLPERPTVSVPPTAPPGEIVERTMAWSRATGFEEARYLAGVIEFDGRHWAGGETDRGLTLWATEDPGGDWEIVSVIEDTGGWIPNDLALVDDQMVLSATHRTEAGALFVSEDGQEWSKRTFESGDSERPIATPLEVATFADGVLVAGYKRSSTPSDELLALFEPPVRELIRSGQAWLDIQPTHVAAVVDPLLEVDRITQSEFPDGFSGARTTEPLIWRGPTLDDLQPTDADWTTQAIVADGEGTLYRQNGTQVVTSVDGADWEPLGPSVPQVISLTPWNEGVVLDVWQERLQYWRRGTESTVPLLPEEFGVQPETMPAFRLQSGPWGLVVGRGSAQIEEPPAPVTIQADNDEELVIHPDLELELLRDGESLWRANPNNSAVAVDEDGRLLFGPTQAEQVAVELDEWLEAFGQTMVRRFTEVHLIHTIDGQRWSSTLWSEITGEEMLAQIESFASHSFVMLVDQSVIRSGGVHSVVVGESLE